MKHKVMVFGTFDLLHEGHRFVFQEAKKFGEELIVVVARDKNVEKFKKRPAVHDELERLKNVKEIIDNAVLGEEEDIYNIIEKIKPDIIVLGYDQDEQNLYEELKKRKLEIQIEKLPAFEEEKYKSSLLREENE